MISYLQGRPIYTSEDSVILDVRGVGYEVFCSAQTLENLSTENLERLWIHTHVREDAMVLYGFLQLAEKQLFLSLIKVNGIGPKMAIKILSAAPTESLMDMVEAGDVQGLTALPKVGKKTAEQIILSLKGKLVATTEGASRSYTARNHLVSALVNLGFRVADVERVVAEMNPNIEFEDGLRDGLSQLSSL